MDIRPATRSDESAIWEIFHAVIAAGDTYAFDPDMPREDAMAYWFRDDTHTYVAEHDGNVVGTYVLKANQPGLGAHVANAAFMVSPNARRQGVGRQMGEHCFVEASRLGFRAIQFNLVAATNVSAIRLWLRLGFKIVGTLPSAFRHQGHGFVDAYVMFRALHASEVTEYEKRLANEEFWPVSLSMREGKRFRVDAQSINHEGVRVFFLTPDQYAAYKLVRGTGKAFAHTHATTLDPPAGDYYWTPPTMGEWWVLISYDCGGPVGAQVVDALSLN